MPWLQMRRSPFFGTDEDTEAEADESNPSLAAGEDMDADEAKPSPEAEESKPSPDAEAMLSDEAAAWEADEAKPFPEAEESKPSVEAEAEAASKGDEVSTRDGCSSLRIEAAAYSEVEEVQRCH